MLLQPTLTTTRLVLRPFRLDDASDLQRLAGEWAIADTTLGIAHPYEDGMAEEWIATHEAFLARGEKMSFAITRQEDDALIGAISLMSIEPGHQAELGYWVGVPFWNAGYCTEAGRAVLQYAFRELGLQRVHASHLTRNPGSGRVMQKLGMRYEGTRRRHVCKWGQFEDAELYGILADEWESE